MRLAKTKHFWPCPLGRGQKCFISLNYNYYNKVNFKDFYTKIFVLMPGSCLRGGTGGVQGCLGGQNQFFWNMVMWHIKLTGMIRGTKHK